MRSLTSSGVGSDQVRRSPPGTKSIGEPLATVVGLGGLQRTQIVVFEGFVALDSCYSSVFVEPEYEYLQSGT